MDTAIGYASLAGVALLTYQCQRIKRRARPSHRLYQDEDGAATRESETEALKITLVKLFMNAATAVGISSWILDGRGSGGPELRILPPGACVMHTVQWLLVAFQVLTIANEIGIRQRYSQGICAAVSTGLLALNAAYQELAGTHAFVLVSTRNICAMTVILACLTLPRRPVVYANGRRVDQKNGASIFSLLSFSWYPLYQPSFSSLNALTLGDLPMVSLSQRFATVQQTFLNSASDDVLLRRLACTFRNALLLQWSLTLIHGLSQFAGQYLLQRLLSCLERRLAQQQSAMGYTVSLGLALLSENMSAGWITWVTQAKLVIPTTALLKGLLFKKMTKKQNLQTREPKTSKTKDAMSLESLMLNDCASVSQAYVSSQHCLKAGFKLLFDVTYLTHLIGLKHIIIGALFPILLFPISKMLAHQHRLSKQDLSGLHSAFSAEVSEMLQGLRQIRLSSMEMLWERRVIGSRARELRQIWYCGVILAFLSLVTNLGPILLISVSLSSYALEVGHLSPSLAFASIGLFRNLHAAIQELPAMVAGLYESAAASRRIDNYLKQRTKKGYGGDDTVSFNNARITWPGRVMSSEAASFSLRDVNLRFPNGKLSVITGKSSSGKGLLLSAILGEAEIQTQDSITNATSTAKHTGTTGTRAAYVPQPPWIENCTIRQNIIFGDEADEERYTAVLRACALEKDLEALPDGDRTLAGVNGGTLSGGQKWRVGLARALYSNASIIVLDDVLSAVDSHVAKWLCDNALSGKLVRNRTVIIATHHLATCAHLASYIVTVENGTASGRTATPRLKNESLTIESIPRSATSSPKPDLVAGQTRDKTGSKASTRSASQAFSVYLFGAGILPVVLAVLATLACRLLAAGNSWWLTKWTSSRELDHGALRFNLYIYLALSVSGAIAVAIHALTVQGVSHRASEALFQKTVQGVLRSPLRWIDSTSLGKLLQSLASDMYLIDHRVATGLSDLLRIIMQLVIVVFTSGIATPQTIAMMIIMLVFYYKITMRHLRVSKRLNKLVPQASQPILEHTNSTESGILTIRAFVRESTYAQRMNDLLDIEMRLSWHMILGQRWIHGRYGILGSLFVCATAISLVNGDADAATAGFAINVALQIKATMSGMMGKINLLTSGSRAIDRVLDIADTPAESQDGEEVLGSWPSSGRIETQHATVRYGKGLPAVLQNITFSLASRERLGVVGRTGAGKSSLVNALLRFIDIDDRNIYIDDVDIATVKLARLRSCISVIPQDPFLFSGTLRSNLNIHGQRSDEDLQAALHKVAIRAKDGQTGAETLHDLETEIQPGGANLSHGQRQMICLARAILDPRPIIILDEATSAVDRATDTMVQAVIRQEFADSTIIVVAHRLATVADFDKVLVLDEGTAVEFGSPAELMAKKGVFWDMVNQSGDAGTVRSAIEQARV